MRQLLITLVVVAATAASATAIALSCIGEENEYFELTLQSVTVDGAALDDLSDYSGFEGTISSDGLSFGDVSDNEISLVWTSRGGTFREGGGYLED